MKWLILLILAVLTTHVQEEDTFTWESSFKLRNHRTGQEFAGSERVSGSGKEAKKARKFAPDAMERYTRLYIHSLEKTDRPGYSVYVPDVVPIYGYSPYYRYGVARPVYVPLRGYYYP